MAKTVYICEHCCRIFENKMDARRCEIQHEHRMPELIKNENFLYELLKEHKDPCNYCSHTYYVYGTEWNCDCHDKCRKMFQDYRLFVSKELENSELYQ